MTDAEKRDAAVAELKLTTQGYLKSNGQPRALVGAQWKKGLDLLAEIGATAPPTPPPSGALSFSEAALSNPIELTIPQATEQFFLPESGRDYLIDLEGKVRQTLILKEHANGPPRNVQFRNVHHRITKPMSTGPYWRGGIGIQLRAEHISVTNYFVEAFGVPGCTLSDGFRLACAPDTKLTLQKARIEGLADSLEAAEHLDAFQVQGPIGSIEVGLATLYASGTRPGKDGGKCFQLKKEPWDVPAGPFSVDLTRVNMVGLGVPGTSRFGHLLLQTTRDIAITLEDVWAASDPDGAGAWDFSAWFYPHKATDAVNGYDTTGAKPNRIARWLAAANIAGEIREGRPPGGDFVTRAALGY